jgi:hypothetical protein
VRPLVGHGRDTLARLEEHEARLAVEDVLEREQRAGVVGRGFADSYRRHAAPTLRVLR